MTFFNVIQLATTNQRKENINLNTTDNWSIFRSASFGENIREVVETEECKVLRIDDATGEGTMTMYHVFDGVILMFNDFHMRSCRSRFSSATISSFFSTFSSAVLMPQISTLPRIALPPSFV